MIGIRVKISARVLGRLESLYWINIEAGVRLRVGWGYREMLSVEVRQRWGRRRRCVCVCVCVCVSLCMYACVSAYVCIVW